MLSRFIVGAGKVEATARGWALQISPSSSYNDAQLDDTQGRPRRHLLHRPPLQLSLEARASSTSPPGTLGFGFWNDPFPSVGGQAGARRLLPALPRALWFFHASPPSDLPFSAVGEGSGWRAASLRSPAWPGPVVAMLGAALVAGMSLRPLRRAWIRQAWRIVAGAQSAPIAGLGAWQRYEIDWSRDQARFMVDGRVVLVAQNPPDGPLGLVLWIDNQWAAFSATAGLRFGIVPHAPEASFEIRDVRLDGNPIEVARQ